MSSKFQTSHHVRRAFLEFFAARGHQTVASASLVPSNDPTLLFTNAGMNQFKDVFTGKAQRAYTRATSSQKCVRAGGKHNDLENVGRTARHHTFFEMLGNFSFGDYFKEEAITFAYELLTKDYALDAKRLVYTVHETDDEARGLWKKIAGVPDALIVGLGDKDNFWAMGDTGPCGPCSEIHFHQGDDIPCAEVAAGRPCLGPACDCDRWIEIWNLVFMQYEQFADKTRRPLPKPSVDTGMGLERLSAVLGGFRSNYEIDLLRPLIDQAAGLAGKAFVPADYAAGSPSVSMRAIADHAPRRRLPDRRRRVPRQDRPRIRPAADHAAGHLPRLAAGDPQALPRRHRRAGDRRDGQRLPRAGRAAGGDRRGDQPGGAPLPGHPGTRASACSRRRQAGCATRWSRASSPSSCTTPTASRRI